jgi:DNA-binding MarR family transcriptional regulator
VLQERLGIGFSQFKILLVLQNNSNIQQKQIADALGQTEASVSRQIKLLTERGLLTTRVSPQNRREHLTTLTPRGVRFTEEALRILNDYHGPVFSVLSEKQQTQLLELLELMHDKACAQTAATEHLVSR